MACTCKEQDFCVQSGETWHPVIRWGHGHLHDEGDQRDHEGAPAVITAAAHGVPNGWPVAVVGVEGMTQINATRYPPQGNDWHAATCHRRQHDRVERRELGDYSTYDEDGFVVYDTPKDLTGCTFALTIYDNPEHTARRCHAHHGGDITVEPTLKTITPLLQTAALAWDIGYFRLMATEPSGVVTELLRGTITIE
jgi:hypothetical protein